MWEKLCLIVDALVSFGLIHTMIASAWSRSLQPFYFQWTYPVGSGSSTSVEWDAQQTFYCLVAGRPVRGFRRRWVFLADFDQTSTAKTGNPSANFWRPYPAKKLRPEHLPLSNNTRFRQLSNNGNLLCIRKLRVLLELSALFKTPILVRSGWNFAAKVWSRKLKK